MKIKTKEGRMFIYYSEDAKKALIIPMFGFLISISLLIFIIKPIIVPLFFKFNSNILLFWFFIVLFFLLIFVVVIRFGEDFAVRLTYFIRKKEKIGTNDELERIRISNNFVVLFSAIFFCVLCTISLIILKFY